MLRPQPCAGPSPRRFCRHSGSCQFLSERGARDSSSRTPGPQASGLGWPAASPHAVSGGAMAIRANLGACGSRKEPGLHRFRSSPTYHGSVSGNSEPRPLERVKNQKTAGDTACPVRFRTFFSDVHTVAARHRAVHSTPLTEPRPLGSCIASGWRLSGIQDAVDPLTCRLHGRSSRRI
jgi:hypothetical protein